MNVTTFTLGVNGESRAVDVAADTPLLWVLRDVLNLTGAKFGCGVARCGRTGRATAAEVAKRRKD